MRPFVGGFSHRVSWYGPYSDYFRMGWGEVESRRFGAALATLRKQQGFSQEALAHAASLTKNQIQLLEKGRSSGRADSTGGSNPRMRTLAGLADALGMTVSELLSTADL